MMDERSLQSLEFTKVLSFLAAFAVSEAGKSACLALRPLSDLAVIRHEALLFDEGHTWLEFTGAQKLVPFMSLDGVLGSACNPASLHDIDVLWALRQILALARTLRDDILADAGLAGWPAWQERCRAVPFPEKTTSALNRCLTDDGRFKENASPELAAIRSELRGLHQQCTRKVKEYATEYNIMHYLQDDFMTLSSDRYVLPLKTNFKGRLQGVVHDYSQTGETCYFEPLFLIEINNHLQELKRDEREEERKLLLFLAGLVGDELEEVRAAYGLLVEVDVLHAKVSLAVCYDGRIVELSEEARIFLSAARHPLLALAASSKASKSHAAYQLQQHDGIAPENTTVSASSSASFGAGHVVSSTIELLSDQQALIISGGNAGGKTVCLKTLGLVALMSKAVLPCPVGPGSRLPLWKDVHAFIGDEQSLDDHVSTFTAQITHLARIWSDLGPHSLIILDEFGAGTDPAQGAALAQAVIDSIMEHKAYVVAATHFPALKAYALSTAGVRSASVLFDPSTKKPLFRLAYEQVGVSQALDVAREHGLPEEILQRANQYLLLSGEDTSVLIERLNSLAVEREEELNTLAKKQKVLDEKQARLSERFEAERTKLFGQVQADAQKIFSEWKLGRIAHKQALRELAQVRATLVAPAEKLNTGGGIDVATLTDGQQVRHVPWNRVCTVLEVDARKKRVRLSLDGVSLWAKEAELALVQSQNAAKVKQVPKTSPVLHVTSIYSLRLDLRGKRADVAINELEKFIDNAVISGRYDIDVVHGKGTGALRRELHAYLKGASTVAEYHLAPEGEGGDGMTRVVLK